MNLADALIPRSYKDGECIIKQGDVADGMYFIEDGTVRICILDEANKEVEVSVFKFLDIHAPVKICMCGTCSQCGVFTIFCIIRMKSARNFSWTMDILFTFSAKREYKLIR